MPCDFGVGKFIPGSGKAKSLLRYLPALMKGENNMEKKSIREITSLVFRALTLAMGIAVTVLSCLGKLEAQTAVTMLGIGLACGGVALLEKQ